MDDFSGLEYDQESVSEEDVVSKTNNLLSQFNLPTQVTSVSDITASLFVVLYESLFSDRLPGIVRQPVTKEDEISNCQTVIDVLSADVIKDNLSHIRGVDIVEGKFQAINNLLDIFTFLYEYVIKQIESDVPTDTDDDVRSFERLEAAVEERPLSRADSLQEREIQEAWGDKQNGMKNGYKSSGKEPVGPQGVDTDGGGEGNGMAPVTSVIVKSTSTVVSAPSPIPPNVSSSLMGQQTLDSTTDLIREGERLERQFERERSEAASKTALNKLATDNQQPGPFDFIGMRPLPTSVSSCVMATSNSNAATTATTNSNATAAYSAMPTKQDAFLESAIKGSNSGATGEPFSTEAADCMTRSPKQDYLDLGPQNMSATEPIPSEYRRPPRSPEKMRATVGEIPVRRRLTPERPYQHREPVMKGLSSSYEDLHEMVQQTAALTRAAIDTSPLRRDRDRAAQLNITDLSQEGRPGPSSAEGMTLARDLNRAGMPFRDAHPFSSGEPSQIDVFGRPQKGAAAAPYPERKTQDREYDTESVPPRKSTTATTYIPPNTDYIRPPSRQSRRPPARSQSDRQQAPQAEVRVKSSLKERGEKKATSDLEIAQTDARHREKENRLETRSDRGIARSRPADAKEVKERRSRLSTRLEEMGKPTLACAQRRLETEDRMFHQKQGFVKKLYEEDFGEAVDEVKDLLSNDRQLMEDMEMEYKRLLRLMGGNAPKKAKPAAKPKGFLLPRTKKSKTLRKTKSPVSRSMSADAQKPRERPLTLADDEDLMPVLLEEFPHMHLSDHTWHELWRKGIHQIENLTRAYEENKRRKSRAQVQLEEAARKHEVLAGIVKKQLDNNQRMVHIKEQKRQQVILNNRTRENRSQSARARRYYNEYQVRARSKMLKRRTREEMIFKNLFKDGLAIQKERIQEVRRYAKEQREKNAQKRQDEIDSLENFYRDQFELLVDKLLKDKDDMAAREKAHQKVLEQMKRDLRNKMEKEIQDIQGQMFRDDDDVYFKQLEADRLRHELQHARYQTRI